jgi:formamidopyrimidine-DNA glycosylase
MPELPEVETIRRDLAARLPGLRVLALTRAEPRMLRLLPPETLRAAVEGRRFLVPLRHGKLLRLPLEGGVELEVHLGMTGSLVLEKWGAAPEAHTHVEFRLEGGQALRFRDPRRFGRWALVRNGKRDGQVFAHAGVDPTAPDFDAPEFHRILTASRAEVKRLLLDQNRIAGLGNIYACEVLFRSGVGPQRRGDTLSVAETGRMFLAIGKVLNMALRFRGTTLIDYRDASGEPGGFKRRLQVYDREGKPCPRCQAKIVRIVQAGRSTFYCKRCQSRRGYQEYSYLNAVRTGRSRWGKDP